MTCSRRHVVIGATAVALVAFPASALANNPSSQTPVTPPAVEGPPATPPPPAVQVVTPPAVTPPAVTPPAVTPPVVAPPAATTDEGTTTTPTETTTDKPAGGVAGVDTSPTPSSPTLVEAATDALPFTGFQAMVVLLGGATLAATGLALRRIGRTQKN